MCRALVIDEVSMLDGSLFDKLDAVARLVRGAKSLPTTHDPKEAPFGGIQVRNLPTIPHISVSRPSMTVHALVVRVVLQLVLCGDFYQLPPVCMEKDKSVKFMFEADAWRVAELQPIVLTQVFRQRDAQFVSLLEEMRRASLSAFSIAQLHHLVHNPPVLFTGATPAAMGAVGGSTFRSVTAHEAEQQLLPSRQQPPSQHASQHGSQPPPASLPADSDATNGATKAARSFAAAAAAAGHGGVGDAPFSVEAADAKVVIDVDADDAAAERGVASGIDAQPASSSAPPPPLSQAAPPTHLLPPTRTLSTRLFAKNEAADGENDMRLDALGRCDQLTRPAHLPIGQSPPPTLNPPAICLTRVPRHLSVQAARGAGDPPLDRLRRGQQDAPQFVHCPSAPLAPPRRAGECTLTNDLSCATSPSRLFPTVSDLS